MEGLSPRDRIGLIWDQAEPILTHSEDSSSAASRQGPACYGDNPPSPTLLDRRQSSRYQYPPISAVPLTILGTKLSGMLRKIKWHGL